MISTTSEGNSNVQNNNEQDNNKVAVIMVDSSSTCLPSKPIPETTATTRGSQGEVYHDAVIEIKPNDEEKKDHEEKLHLNTRISKRRLSLEVECDLNLGGLDYSSDGKTISILPDPNYSKKHPRKESKTDTINSVTEVDDSSNNNNRRGSIIKRPHFR